MESQRPESPESVFVNQQRPFSALSNHLPPRYDIQGRLLPQGKGSGLGLQTGKYSTISGKPRMPRSWDKPVETVKRSELLARRRQDPIPDPSFDLDGDGVVSQKDYFFAKRFDADGDGKLNATEKRTALEALASGYADNFHFMSGPPAELPEHRVFQRRGRVLREEDESYQQLHETYDHQDLAPAVEFAPFALTSKGGVDDAPDHQARSLARKQRVQTRSELLKLQRKREVLSMARKTGAEIPFARSGQGHGNEAKLEDDDMADLAGRGPGDMADTQIGEDFGRTTRANAASRSELFETRQRTNLHDVLQKQGLSPESAGITMGATASSDNLGVTRGLDSLSKTNKELKGRRRQLFREEAARFAPTKPPGVHKAALPSFADRLNELQQLWTDETAAMQKAESRPWAGSALDGADPEAARRAPDVTGRHGRRLDATTSQPLVRSGIVREEDLPADTLSTREISTLQLAKTVKNRKDHSTKVTAIDHWNMAEKAASGGGHGQQSGAPKFTKKRWTDQLIEYKLLTAKVSGADPSLDEHGKQRYTDPKDLAPLYSSFAPDGVFRPQGANIARIEQSGATTSFAATSRSLRSAGSMRTQYGTAIKFDPNSAANTDAPPSAAHSRASSPSPIDASAAPSPPGSPIQRELRSRQGTSHSTLASSRQSLASRELGPAGYPRSLRPSSSMSASSAQLRPATSGSVFGQSGRTAITPMSSATSRLSASTHNLHQHLRSTGRMQLATAASEHAAKMEQAATPAAQAAPPSSQANRNRLVMQLSIRSGGFDGMLNDS